MEEAGNIKNILRDKTGNTNTMKSVRKILCGKGVSDFSVQSKCSTLGQWVL